MTAPPNLDGSTFHGTDEVDTSYREFVKSFVIRDEEMDASSGCTSELDRIWRLDGWVFAQFGVDVGGRLIKRDDLACVPDRVSESVGQCKIPSAARANLHFCKRHRGSEQFVLSHDHSLTESFDRCKKLRLTFE